MFCSAAEITEQIAVGILLYAGGCDYYWWTLRPTELRAKVYEILLKPVADTAQSINQSINHCYCATRICLEETV